jgi:hypothetical protein
MSYDLPTPNVKIASTKLMPELHPIHGKLDKIWSFTENNKELPKGQYKAYVKAT